MARWSSEKSLFKWSRIIDEYKRYVWTSWSIIQAVSKLDERLSDHTNRKTLDQMWHVLQLFWLHQYKVLTFYKHLKMQISLGTGYFCMHNRKSNQYQTRINTFTFICGKKCVITCLMQVFVVLCCRRRSCRIIQFYLNRFSVSKWYCVCHLGIVHLGLDRFSVVLGP